MIRPEAQIKETIESLTNVLKDLKNQLLNAQIPTLKIQTRSKSNLVQQDGFWNLGTDKQTKKTLKTKGGSKQILKLVHTIAYLIEQLKTNRTSTLRDFYYAALNWIDEAQFEQINNSNTCLENLEILLNRVREDFGMYPNSDGKIYGAIEVEYKTRNNESKRLHCSKDAGTAGYLLPRCMSEVKILSVSAKFMLVVETEGMYNRLIEEKFDQRYNCLLMTTGGQASRMTKMFIKKLNDQYNVRSAIFADGDIHGITIANNIIQGAIKSSHLSRRLCTPNAVHIGLFPSQIKQYALPTYDITKLERQNIHIMLEDPRYTHITDELKLMAQTGVKAQQQAFAYHGLPYVTDVYLPNVLRKYDFI